MALNSLFCADVPLSNYSHSHALGLLKASAHGGSEIGHPPPDSQQKQQQQAKS